ncbi:hypothetical protein GS934_15565 [Rhodococcus hoagii]|nr:hypothetical protein [Prescottella equi]NKZ88077.1 hypothetical protein [Prescottella equi]
MSGTAAAASPTGPPPRRPAVTSGRQPGWKTEVVSVNGVAGNVANPGDTVTTGRAWENIWERRASEPGPYMTSIRTSRRARRIPVPQREHHAPNGTVTSEGAGRCQAVCAGNGCTSVPVLGTDGFKVIGSTLRDFHPSTTRSRNNFAPVTTTAASSSTSTRSAASRAPTPPVPRFGSWTTSRRPPLPWLPSARWPW